MTFLGLPSMVMKTLNTKFFQKFPFVSEILKCRKNGTREGKGTNISQAEK